MKFEFGCTALTCSMNFIFGLCAVYRYYYLKTAQLGYAEKTNTRARPRRGHRVCVPLRCALVTAAATVNRSSVLWVNRRRVRARGMRAAAAAAVRARSRLFLSPGTGRADRSGPRARYHRSGNPCRGQ